MMTVKEVSKLTGISVRTLHYYDEIGLLKPASISSGGYRLYDNKALEKLQQILFFREFDIPLKEIKAVMENPALEKKQILQMQRKMLTAKKERMERLIADIDNILKGENKMDFEVFSKSEIEGMFQSMLEHMPKVMKELSIKEFGSIEKWKEHYIEVVSGEEMQKAYGKVVEWYGDKESALKALNNPPNKAAVKILQEKIDDINKILYKEKNNGVNSLKVHKLIEEYGTMVRNLYGFKCEKGMMLAIAKDYRSVRVKEAIDKRYGEGASGFFAEAIEKFYRGE